MIYTCIIFLLVVHVTRHYCVFDRKINILETMSPLLLSPIFLYDHTILFIFLLIIYTSVYDTKSVSIFRLKSLKKNKYIYT